MSLDAKALMAAMESHALASGRFARLNRHEPKGAPGKGLTGALWVQRIQPAMRQSGLVATTGRVEFRLRLYTPMLAEPQDEIDPEVIAATDVLMAAYSGDFTLGGLVAAVDLLGAHGEPLSAVAGYTSIGSTMQRVVDLIVPLIVNDLWAQAP